MTMLNDPRATRTLALVFAVVVILPVGLRWVAPASLLVPVVTTLVAVCLSRLVPGESPRTFLQIWLVSGIVRWAALTLAVLAQRSLGTVILGGDGRQFLTRALHLAASGFSLDNSPIYEFGTYDVGPYYFFAALVWAFGQNLVVLQMANAALSSLVAPLTYAWAQRFVPRRALLIGLVLALYPTAIVFAVVDLLKDPSVLLATTAAFCGIVYLAEDVPTLTSGRRAGLVLLALSGLAYLHISRFYTLLFLGLATVGAGGLVLAWRRQWHWRPVSSVALVLILAECAFVPLGWPPTPALMVISARGVLGNTASEREADEARTKSESAPGTGPGATRRRAGIVAREESLPQLAAALRVAGGGSPGAWSTAPGSAEQNSGEAPSLLGMEGDRDPYAEARTPTALRVDTAAYRALPAQAGIKGRVIDVVRKLLGPFIWVMPPDVSLRTLMAGDYLLYPGMLLWYGAWPFMVAGLAWAGLQWLRGRTPLMVGALALFCGAYLALYLGVNLSFRQRDALLPFLLVLAAGSYDVVRSWRGWPWAYGAYWMGLVALATAHLVARSRLAE